MQTLRWSLSAEGATQRGCLDRLRARGDAERAWGLGAWPAVSSRRCVRHACLRHASSRRAACTWMSPPRVSSTLRAPRDARVARRHCAVALRWVFTVADEREPRRDAPALTQTRSLQHVDPEGVPHLRGCRRSIATASVALKLAAGASYRACPTVANACTHGVLQPRRVLLAC